MKLYSKAISTPLGMVRAVSDDKHLLSLDFEGSKYTHLHYPQCGTKTQNNHILELTEKELTLYFLGELKEFSVPIKMNGTDFQQKVWKELLKIPYGTTLSYQEQAIKVGNIKSVRAVAHANSRNKISIIIPCHRVIGKNQKLTGYAGGIDKKEFLLNLEKKCF